MGISKHLTCKESESLFFPSQHHALGDQRPSLPLTDLGLVPGPLLHSRSPLVFSTRPLPNKWLSQLIMGPLAPPYHYALRPRLEPGYTPLRDKVRLDGEKEGILQQPSFP